MFCFNCGQELADAVRFCSNCGTNLRGVAVRPTTEIETEVVNDIDSQTETEAKTSFESLPFESLIIEKFDDKLPDSYIRHVKNRLQEAVEDAHNTHLLNDDDYYALVEIVYNDHVNTFGDLAFHFKRLHTQWPLMRPTIHILIELLFRVYLKR